jgi:hypothetical protein
MPTWQFKETTLLMAIFHSSNCQWSLDARRFIHSNYSNRRPRAALCVCSVRTRYNFLMWLSRDIRPMVGTNVPHELIHTGQCLSGHIK